MKALVTYFSQTSNTQRVAEAIFEALPDAKEMTSMSDVKSLDGYDVVFVGFPIHSGRPAKPAMNFLQSSSTGQKLALFITHGSPEDAPAMPRILDECRTAAQDAELVGIFHCQGELSPDVISVLLNSDKPSHRAFGEYGPRTAGLPDESRLTRARDFARTVTASD